MVIGRDFSTVAIAQFKADRVVDRQLQRAADIGIGIGRVIADCRGLTATQDHSGGGFNLGSGPAQGVCLGYKRPDVFIEHINAVFADGVDPVCRVGAQIMKFDRIQRDRPPVRQFLPPPEMIGMAFQTGDLPNVDLDGAEGAGSDRTVEHCCGIKTLRDNGGGIIRQ